MLLLFNCKKDILYVHLTQEVTDFVIAITQNVICFLFCCFFFMDLAPNVTFILLANL